MQFLRGCYVKKSSWQLFYFSSMVCVFVGFVIGEYPKTKLERRHEIPFWVDRTIEKVSRTCSLFFKFNTLSLIFHWCNLEISVDGVLYWAFPKKTSQKLLLSCWANRFVHKTIQIKWHFIEIFFSVVQICKY